MSKPRPELADLWRVRIKEWRTSGKSKAQWCRDENLSYHQFFYWIERLYPKSEQASDLQFTELQDREPTDPGVRLECGDVCIRLAVNFDEDALLRCLRVMQRTS